MKQKVYPSLFFIGFFLLSLNVFNARAGCITVTASPNVSVCVGSNAQLSASVSGGTAPYTYSWMPATGLNDPTIANPIAISPLFTTPYKVYVTDAASCTDSASVVITVNPFPVINIGPDPQICLGASVTLNASGGTVFSWLPSAGLSCGNCPSPVATPSVTTTYTVFVTNGSGCTSSSVTTVTVNPLPVIGISNPVTICHGDVVQLSSTGTNWSPPAGLNNTNISNPLCMASVTTTYTVVGVDFNGCYNTASTTVTVLQHCNKVSGYSYIDKNSNNIQDIGEPAYPFLNIQSVGNAFSYLSKTDAQGFFINFTDTGNIQTSVQNLPPAYTCTPLVHSSNFSGGSNYDSVNFALIPIPGIQDLRITIIPLNFTRSNTDITYRLQYSNFGSDSISGVINLIKDSRLSYVSSNPGYVSVSGDSASWNYSNLLPTETRIIDVVLHIPPPPAVGIGTVLTSSCVINPVVTDTIKPDNYFVLNDKVVGSYDPNDKTMLGGDNFTTAQLANGDFLTYLIRFQNTGNDTAFKIVVRDTLDNKLDGSTFEMVSASNDYSLSIENQKNIAWTFDNVLLPDSNVNEPASHGYVCYRIKAKSGVSAGDVISNTGHIFFDYNPDVLTNTTMTSVVSAVQEIHSNATGLLLYPNPAKEEFTVYGLQFTVEGRIEVYNLLGEQVYSDVFNGKQKTVNCKPFPEGIYFIRISGNAGTLRLVKID